MKFLKELIYIKNLKDVVSQAKDYEKEDSKTQNVSIEIYNVNFKKNNFHNK